MVSETGLLQSQPRIDATTRITLRKYLNSQGELQDPIEVFMGTGDKKTVAR
jgi:hypothetical protein